MGFLWKFHKNYINVPIDSYYSSFPEESRYITVNLCQCFIVATRDNTTDATNWMKVVTIVQASFRYGMLAEERTW